MSHDYPACAIFCGGKCTCDEADSLVVVGGIPPDFPLPDSLFDSKDWRAANYAGRVEWLFTMYASCKAERDVLLEQSSLVGGAPIRMLTDNEATEALKFGPSSPYMAAAVIGKFCEVNGLSLGVVGGGAPAGAPAVSCGCRLGVKLSPWQCPVHGEPAQPDTGGQQP